MAVHERAARSPAAGERAIELGPPVASRATLDPAARRESIEFYFLTRAAGQAWAAINARLNAGGGAIFWICDAPGTGKTHFLNYVLAMEERAAHERMRHAMIRLDLGSAAQADDLEQRMFDLLSRAIGIADTGVALWRRLHGGEALALALDQARRVGFRAVSIAVDFGTVDASSCHDYLVALARAAARNRPPSGQPGGSRGALRGRRFGRVRHAGHFSLRAARAPGFALTCRTFSERRRDCRGHHPRACHMARNRRLLPADTSHRPVADPGAEQVD